MFFKKKENSKGKREEAFYTCEGAPPAGHACTVQAFFQLLQLIEDQGGELLLTSIHGKCAVREGTEKCTLEARVVYTLNAE